MFFGFFLIFAVLACKLARGCLTGVIVKVSEPVFDGAMLKGRREGPTWGLEKSTPSWACRVAADRVPRCGVEFQIDSVSLVSSSSSCWCVVFRPDRICFNQVRICGNVHLRIVSIEFERR